MKYDGVVAKFDDLYLFILNPKTLKIMDGISLSNHKCYDDLNQNQLMVVEVIFKDGTQEIENIDLEEFIYGDSYDRHSIFIAIYDINLFSISDKKNSKKILSLEQIARNGELTNIAIDCINLTKLKTPSDNIQENIQILKKELNDFLK